MNRIVSLMTALLAASALVLSGCGGSGSSAPASNAATNTGSAGASAYPKAVSVTAAAPPVIAWTGGKAISLTVGTLDGQEAWVLGCPSGSACIASPVTYGVVPSGAAETQPAAALTVGAYQVGVFFDANSIQYESIFTYFSPGIASPSLTVAGNPPVFTWSGGYDGNKMKLLDVQDTALAVSGSASVGKWMAFCTGDVLCLSSPVTFGTLPGGTIQGYQSPSLLTAGAVYSVGVMDSKGLITTQIVAP